MKKELMYDIGYTAIVIILVLLSLLSAALNLWILFCVWIVFLSVFLFTSCLLSKKPAKKKIKKPFQPKPLFNLIYTLIPIILILLASASIFLKQWLLFILWIVIFPVTLIITPMLRKKLPKEPKKPKRKKRIFKRAFKKKKKLKEKKEIKVEEKKEEPLPKPIPGKPRPKLKIIELKEQKKKPETRARKVETEFDQLTQLVKEKKELKFSEIEKRFKLKRNKVEEWAKLLESHGLVEIKYPTFGEPRLIYKEK